MSDEFIELPEVNVYDKPPPIGEVAASALLCSRGI